MIYLSASEVKQNFAEFLDQAQKEPVTIQGQDQDLVVVLMKNIYLDGWTINANLYFSENPIPHKFIFDSDTKSISIYGITKTIWKEEPSTSDLMMIISCIFNSKYAVMEGFGNLHKIPKLMRLYNDYLGKNQIN